MTKSVVPSAAPVSENRDPGHRAFNSPVIKRSIIRNGHKSSVSLEDQFWDGLREIAGRENVTVSALVGTIDRRNCAQLSIGQHDRDARAAGTAAPQAS